MPFLLELRSWFYKNLKDNGISNLKIVGATQARIIYKYKNIKRKVLNCDGIFLPALSQNRLHFYLRVFLINPLNTELNPICQLYK